MNKKNKEEENKKNNVDEITAPIEAETETALKDSFLSEEVKRNRRQKFFRARKSSSSPVAAYRVTPGAKWSEEEADKEIKNFLLHLAGERVLIPAEDPISLAKENDLLLLFGPEEEEEFARLALRFPEETIKNWATLLSGGSRSEAFGPRSRSERRSEAAIVSELQNAVLRRGIAAAIAAAIVVALFFGLSILLDSSEEEASIGLRFSQEVPTMMNKTDDRDQELINPVAESVLVADADKIVALRKGNEALIDRIRIDVSEVVLPIEPGALRATVFQFGQGQVALVGPQGWVNNSCTRVSVTTKGLRPLDVIYHNGENADCPLQMPGRQAEVTCKSETVLIFSINIPQRENPQKLAEGGTGWAEKVRFGVEGITAPNGSWEQLSVRGTIEVPVGVENIVIPKFAGNPGDIIEVDLGVGPQGRRLGTCTLK